MESNPSNSPLSESRQDKDKAKTNSINADDLFKEVETLFSRSQEKQTELTSEVTDENALFHLDKSKLDPAEDILEPPVCILMGNADNEAPIGNLGDFSLVMGKAKSRKTFFITIALASALTEARILNCMKGSLPDNQKVVLFFDTEQSKYHALKSVKRVCRLIGIPVPPNFMAFGLRRYCPADRVTLIEKSIYSTPNLGFVAIDGARDLVYSINDEEQATTLSGKLLKWTAEKNIHIMVALHQNKGDNNARGHLGTELLNKAQTALSVTKDQKNKDISVVEADYCREKDPQPFAFQINIEGLPELIEDWLNEVPTKRKLFDPGDLPKATHQELLVKMFKSDSKPKIGSLKIQIKLAFEKHDIRCGISRAGDILHWYMNEGYIVKRGTDRSPQAYYELLNPL